MAQEQNTPVYSEQEQIRRDKLAALREAGHDPYLLTKVPVDTKSSQIKADFDAYDGKDVTLAGRMMTRRIMGKASFAHMLDTDGDSAGPYPSGRGTFRAGASSTWPAG